jgi:proteasome lid subunit RPN8/RPN11
VLVYQEPVAPSHIQEVARRCGPVCCGLALRCRDAHMENANAVISPLAGRENSDVVLMSAGLCLRLVRTAERTHQTGLKSFGVLVGQSADERPPFRVHDVVFFDPRKNRRNDPGIREAFHAQGEYFRRYDDAGFVADPTELLKVYQELDDSGREILAPFHVHRRQPANFSLIDYRLHNPAFAWHLIISLRTPGQPRLQPFRIHKDSSAFGISEDDALQGSELAYVGCEVEPLSLLVHGFPEALARLHETLGVCEVRATAAAVS